MAKNKIIDAAEQFIWLSGRVLERARFENAYRGASADRVVAALAPYQNPDGGFGQGLEPDFRGPVSQPLAVDTALRALEGIEADALLAPTQKWLLQIRASDGGVPNVLGNVDAYPRAPWFAADPGQPGSLLPTASIAGLLYQRNATNAFAREVSEFCFHALEGIPARLKAAKERLPKLQALYELRAGVLFLDQVPDRARAEKLAQTLGHAVHEAKVFGAGGEAADELDFAARPTSLARHWFDDKTIEKRLTALRASQDKEGGFPITWEAFTPAAGIEWRAIQTLERLTTLRAYDAL